LKEFLHNELRQDSEDWKPVRKCGGSIVYREKSRFSDLIQPQEVVVK
jgi:hypothetical protein